MATKPTTRESKRYGKETIRQVTERLANRRVNDCVAKMLQVGNLASGQYEITPEDVASILGTLRSTVDAVEARFLRTKETRPTFSL